MKNNPKNKGNLKINIKKSYLDLRIGNIFAVIAVIVTGIISGVILCEYVVEAQLGKYKDEQVSMSVEQSLEDDRQLNKTIQQISSCLVTIGGDKEILESPNYDNNNITGIIMNSKGYIVTNYSLLKEYKNIYVKLQSIGSNVMSAAIVGYDENADIVLIKVDAVNLPQISYSVQNEIFEGQRVMAIGNTFSNGSVGIATFGRVISNQKKTKVSNLSLIEVDSIINNENTGGALCSYDGRLLGILSKKVSSEYGESGVYYAINISEYNKVFNKITQFL